jgi:glycosyltransferase involved in cell wall biosynthesis
MTRLSQYEAPGILHLVGSFHQGGSERQALQVVRLLQRSGRFRVLLACLSKEGVLRSEADTLMAAIPDFPLTSFYNLNACVQLRRFARFLCHHRIDVVQTHDFYTNMFGMIGAWMARVPVRIAARRETGGVRTATQLRAEHAAYRLASVIVANAGAIRDQLVREGLNGSKIEVVHNGVDLSRFPRHQNLPRAAILHGLGLSDHERRYVTIIANMRYPVKDHVTFLRAARIIAASVPNTSFLLAGEGELSDSLHRLARELGLADHAVFLGRSTSIRELLSVSEVCVLTSRAEGFPNAVLEYMAAGRPVVTTDVGGVREAVLNGESGYIVPVGDEKQIAERVIELLRNPEKAAAFGSRGRQTIEQHFSCEAQLAALEALYSRLLAHHRPARALPDLTVAPAQPPGSSHTISDRSNAGRDC